MVIYLKTKGVKEIKNLTKIDKITQTITIISCICLGSIFLSACIYMLNMIDETNEQSVSNNSNTPQNMNLVKM